ncbi:MAG: leucine-rich repeat protein [Lachnospiraceae bacterium]|nr:leucine-rich repeat protein [Lachnospiraceae bacterium]
MKKNVRRALSFIVSIVMVLAVLPVFSFPMRAKAETPSNDFEYEVNEKGEITITGYTGSDTDIVIPAEIDKKQVVGVGNRVFYNNDSIIRVTFEGNVDNIGEYAFYNCGNLTHVIFEGETGNIGEKAFYECNNLVFLLFNLGVRNIGENAFKDCTKLDLVIIPQTTIISTGGFPTNTVIIKYGFDSDTYTGQIIPFEVKVGDTLLQKDKDYFVSYFDDKNEIKDVGEYGVYIIMFNPDTVCFAIRHKVNPLDLSTCDLIHGDSQYIYDGNDYNERIINNILVRFNDQYPISSENYTVDFLKEGETDWKSNLDITEAGNYKVRINSKGNNCTGEIIGNFTINPKSLKNQSIIIDLPGFSNFYTGQIIAPTVIVKDGNKELVKDQDYTVEYIDNTSVSRDESGNVIAGATIKIKGIGNYDSEITKFFTICPKALTITADNASKACDGSELTKESYTNTDLADGDRIESVTITGSQTYPGSSDNVPSGVKIINSAGEDVTSCYDITYANGTLTVEDHVFDMEVVTDKYLAKEADFTHGKIYYYSCKCGETGTETFEAGEPLPTYTITFDANGGSVNTASDYTNAEYKLDSLPTPEYDGYNFLGWFTNETGGDEITTSTVFGANMTIYAHWEKKEEPKPAQGGTEKPETPTEPSVPETPATPEIPETPETPSEPEAPETEDVKEETKSDYLDELYAMLREAIAKGGEQTITWSVGDSLPYDVMKILEENPQITLVFNYTYMGEDFNVTIRGRDVQADPKVKWCGPLYLYSIYGGYKTDENGLKESGTYIVQAGDTLSALAAKFDTTIKNLVALNNIKDENLIFIGQELKY